MKISDQCNQYKKDYEKLLELKREFDEALGAGNKTRGFGEVMRPKDEIEKVLRDLEFDLKYGNVTEFGERRYCFPKLR